MGPLATQILGDLGADVIRSKTSAATPTASWARARTRSCRASSLNLLRNKRNISLDLKHPDGREACLRLAERADIVVTNLRPGPLGRLRPRLRRRARPQARHHLLPGAGLAHRRARRRPPAYDDVVQSASGIADIYRQQRRRAAHRADDHGRQGERPHHRLRRARRAAPPRPHRRRPAAWRCRWCDAMQAFMLVEHGADAIPEPPLGPHRLPAGADRRPAPAAHRRRLDPHAALQPPELRRPVPRSAAATTWPTTRVLAEPGHAARPTWKCCTRPWSTMHAPRAPPPSGWRSATSTTSRAARIVDLDDVVAAFPVAEHPRGRAVPRHPVAGALRRHARVRCVGTRAHRPATATRCCAEAGYTPDEVAAPARVGRAPSRRSRAASAASSATACTSMPPRGRWVSVTRTVLRLALTASPRRRSRRPSPRRTRHGRGSPTGTASGSCSRCTTRRARTR